MIISDKWQFFDVILYWQYISVVLSRDVYIYLVLYLQIYCIYKHNKVDDM